MKEIKCPFCGRENIRGKFCMFCGNPLSGDGAAGGGNAAFGKPGDDQRWDPETAYARHRGRTVVLIAALAVLVAAVAVVLSAQENGGGIWTQSYGAPLGAPGATSLEEMTAMLEKAGMESVGDPYRYSDAVYQQFAPFRILNEETDYSVAAVQNGQEIGIAHIFSEKKGSYTVRRPGPVFNSLLERLTKRYGKPVIRGTEDFYCWTKGRDMLILYYAAYSSEIRLEFHETVRETAV